MTLPRVALVAEEPPRLREARSTARSLRIVALTGYGQSEDRRRTQEAGFDVHITKPATVDDVIAALAA